MSAGKLEERVGERGGGTGGGGRLSTAAPTSNKHARTSNFEY